MAGLSGEFSAHSVSISGIVPNNVSALAIVTILLLAAVKLRQ